ncbi:MAG TPA: flagellar motor switch protein FliG [Gallionella sp.]|jgi:flagellar motor switch protein FliG|uniref:Flagellar motor switch protein FliG n=1 Tax=Gallionella capsiferriformans (strain ES-2) TaxID=395494 RepID=D9SF01_GALCS|nr:flagellar motor switch protein FliG [Gallionella capsiferriformans]ADL55098.1 flagellar motor switch protein FliG [Gallionella capsiferriformans ES-2]MDP1871784.1 flagellar motor switch protein FliG [Gallionella sp.]OGS68759.1 MAG: flagellar motor switch protein FliG [Gallionellales bacterium GWA2_54_124]HCI53395.1 flagellar motor switch protein FliG [Gallionella sp.]
MSDGVQNSAIFLMTLGENEAAEVLKYLGPKEVQKISTAMVALSNLTRDQISQVFHEFLVAAAEKTTIGMDSNDYIRSMLTKALGDDKAAGLLDRIMHSSDTSGIESLKWMDPGAVAEMIGNEHPQIIATILVHLEPDQAASIMKMLTDRTRNDVLLRISTLDGVQPVALRELNDVLSKLMSGGSTGKKSLKGGVSTAAEILNFMGGTLEAEMMEKVRSFDPDLAQKIEDKMFVFENILEVDDRGIQLILREVQSEALIIALKGAGEELREKIFKNMSSRAAEMMREDLESKGPVKLSEVEANQKEILKVVKRLSDEGQIALGGKGDEDAYV